MPRPAVNRTPEGYVKKLERQAKYGKMKTRAAQDIGPIPDVTDPVRRFAATQNLRCFCDTYFPLEFSKPWSRDHLTVLETMQESIELGGLFAFAMPRGNGKTTMIRAAALWAVLTGRRRYVCIIGGSKPRALEMLVAIKTTILSPEMWMLREDFPEALFPLWELEGSPKRTPGQHICGARTYCVWTKDKLVVPTVVGDTLPGYLQDLGLEESPSSGAIITVTSLDSHIRGQQHSRMDGTVARPDLLLLDDPQTRESAKSPTQTAFRLQLLNGDVLGLPGPGQKPAVFLACTVMYEKDLADGILDIERYPQWHSKRTKMVYTWPTNTKLWDEYRKIREQSLRSGMRGVEATAFYKTHQKEMDEGSDVAWSDRKNEDDVSAIQHSQNLRFDLGDSSFGSEYQNEPMVPQDVESGLAKPDLIMSRVNGRPRGEVPMECAKLTAFIDMHKELLFWSVIGWKEDMTSFVIDYGTYPDQVRNYFTLTDAPRTLSSLFLGSGEDGALQTGLEALVGILLARTWPKSGGSGLASIDRLMIDIGYKPEIAAAVKYKFKASASIIWLSKGVGIRAGNKPISTYQRRPGWILAQNWYVPSVQGTREFPHVCVDVNHWKSFIHARFLTIPGDPGSLTIFGSHPWEHSLFSQHVGGSETYVTTSGHGRQVQEWRLRPEKPDNHWLDSLVGCAAAASMLGIGDRKDIPITRRKHYTQSDLTKRRSLNGV